MMCKKLICEIEKTPGKLQEKNASPSSAPVTVVADTGFYGLSKVNIPAVKLQEKSAKAGETSVEVTPDADFYGLSKVNIEANRLQEKSVKATSTPVEVTADARFYGLSKVNIAAAKLQEKTVKAAGNPTEVTADDGFYGLEKVTVDAIKLQEKSVNVQNEAQDVVADENYTALSRVSVAGFPTQEKTVTITGDASIEPDAGYKAMTKVDVTIKKEASYNDFVDFMTYGGSVKVFKTDLEYAIIYAEPFVNFGKLKLDHFRIIDAPHVRATPNLNVYSYDPYYPGFTLQKIRCFNVPEGSFNNRSFYELKEIYYTSDNAMNFSYYEDHPTWVGEFGAFSKLEKIIIPNNTLVGCSSIEGLLQIPAFTDGTGKIYVKDELVDQYKTATNWATVADYIRPISEYEAAGGWNYDFYAEEGDAK